MALIRPREICDSLSDAAVSSTGLTETAARAAGLDVAAAVVMKEHHAGYYPGAVTGGYLSMIAEGGFEIEEAREGVFDS